MTHSKDTTQVQTALLRDDSGIDTPVKNNLCCAAAGIIAPSSTTSEALIPREKLREATTPNVTLIAQNRPPAQPVVEYTHPVSFSELNIKEGRIDYLAEFVKDMNAGSVLKCDVYPHISLVLGECCGRGADNFFVELHADSNVPQLFAFSSSNVSSRMSSRTFHVMDQQKKWLDHLRFRETYQLNSFDGHRVPLDILNPANKLAHFVFDLSCGGQLKKTLNSHARRSGNFSNRNDNHPIFFFFVSNLLALLPSSNARRGPNGAYCTYSLHPCWGIILGQILDARPNQTEANQRSEGRGKNLCDGFPRIERNFFGQHLKFSLVKLLPSPLGVATALRRKAMATHNVISGGKDSTPTLLDAIAQNAFCLLASICQIDNAKTPSREIPCDLVVSMDATDCSSAYIIYNSYLNSAATREVA
jgi:hypothetical protein